MSQGLRTAAIVLTITLSFPSLASADLFDRGRIVRGSGEIVSQDRQLPAFDEISLRSSCDLTITIGEPSKVVVTGDDNLIDLVRTEVSHGVLDIDTKSGASFSTRRGLRVEITMPSLVRLDMTGSGDADLNGLSQADLELRIHGSGDVVMDGSVTHLEINVRGSGDVSAYELAAEDIHVRSAGSGDIMLEGKAEVLDIYAGGSGSVNARRLTAKEAAAEVHGSGDVSLQAEDRFEGAVFGSGDIDLYGNPPKVNRRVSGSGDIIRH